MDDIINNVIGHIYHTNYKVFIFIIKNFISSSLLGTVCHFGCARITTVSAYYYIIVI